MCESQVLEACDFLTKPSHCQQQVLLETRRFRPWLSVGVTPGALKYTDVWVPPPEILM